MQLRSQKMNWREISPTYFIFQSCLYVLRLEFICQLNSFSLYLFHLAIYNQLWSLETKEKLVGSCKNPLSCLKKRFVLCKNFKLCLSEKILKIVRAFLCLKLTSMLQQSKQLLSCLLPSSIIMLLGKKKKLLLCNLGLSITCFLIHVTNQLNKDVMGMNFRQRFQEQYIPLNMSFSFTWSVLKLILNERVYLSQILSRTATRPLSPIHCIITQSSVEHMAQLRNHHFVKPLKYDVVFYRNITLTLSWLIY